MRAHHSVLTADTSVHEQGQVYVGNLIEMDCSSTQVYEASLAVLLLGYCEDCRIHQGKPALSPRRLVETLQVLHS